MDREWSCYPKKRGYVVGMLKRNLQGRHWGLSLAMVLLVTVLLSVPLYANTILRVGTFVALDRFNELYSSQLDAFRQANPEIQLDVEYLGGGANYTTQLILLAVTNDLPDVIMIPPEQAAPLVNAGILADLTPYYERDLDDVDAWFPVAVDAVQFGDIIFGVPAWFVNYTYAYNKDLMDQRGLEHPDFNEWVTWDYIRDTARRLTTYNAEGTVDVWGYYHGVAYTEVLPLVYQAGGSVYDENQMFHIDHEPMYTAADWLYSLIQDGVHGGSRSLFYQGKVATMRMGSNQMDLARSAEGDIAVVSGIQFRQKDEVVYLTSYGMTRGTQNEEAAWRFLQYIPSPESQAFVVERGRVPVRRDVPLEGEEDMTALLAGFVQSITQARPFPYHVHSNHVQTAFTQATAPIWRGEAPAQSLIPQIERSINALLVNHAE